MLVITKNEISRETFPQIKEAQCVNKGQITMRLMGNKGLIRGEPTTTNKGQDKAQPFTRNQDLLIAKTGLAIGFTPHFDLLDYALGAIILPVFRVKNEV